MVAAVLSMGGLYVSCICHDAFVVIFYAGNILTGKAINELPPFTIAFFSAACCLYCAASFWHSQCVGISQHICDL